MLIKSLILAFSVILQLTSCFYIQKNTLRKSENVIDDFKIIHSSLDGEFPNEFKVELRVKRDKHIPVSFKKLEKDNSHPIGNDDMYTLNEFMEVVKIEIDEDRNQEYELYREVNGKGTATLIRNKLKENELNQNHNRFRMVGTVYDDLNTHYEILPVNNAKDSIVPKGSYNHNKNSHIITKRSSNPPEPVEQTLLTDYDINKEFEEKYERMIKSRIENEKKIVETKQQTSDSNFFDLYVELLVVTDPTVYEDHKRYSGSNDSSLIFLHMRTYFAHTINLVNERYQNSFFNDTQLNITIKLTNYLFLTDEKYSNWTNINLVGNPDTPYYKGRQVIIDNKSWLEFQSFMKSIKLPFTYDHAMGFFNKDLWSNRPGTNDDRARFVGYTIKTMMCTDQSISIMEEIGAFAHIKHIAHEMGHSLSAYHDGDPDPFNISSKCNASDNFIMSSNVAYFKNEVNLHRHSPCSVRSYKNFILSSNVISGMAQCLTNVPNKNGTLAQSSSKLKFPGQSWTADDQCKMIYGSEASYCRKYASIICNELWCRSNATQNCTVVIAIEATGGTNCAAGKLCDSGECKSNSKATMDECYLGDDSLVNKADFNIFELPSVQMTCESVVDYANKMNKSGIALCSDSMFRASCCKYCQRYSVLKCMDNDLDCPQMVNSCSNQTINEKCPFTCKTCTTDSLINCASNVDSKYVCQNGGVCVNSSSNFNNLGYICNCTNDYEGYFCEKKKNPCIPSPCMNGEICQKFGSIGYICLNSTSRVFNCENGPCDIEFLTTEPKSTTIGPQNLGPIIGGTVSGIVFLILVAGLTIAVIIIVYTRKKKNENAEEQTKNTQYDQTYKDQTYNNTYYEKRISNRYSEPYVELYQNVNKNKKTYENVARLDSIDLTTVNNQHK